MKLSKIVLVVFFLQAVIIYSLPAISAEEEIRRVFETLSREYSNQYPQIIVKKGLAILPFKEESALAKKAGIGNTIRELISRQAAKSTIFYLVDRDILKESLKEQKLALSGLINEKTAIEPGNTAGIAVFINGSISEIKDDYQISIKITDVETSKVVGIEIITIPAEELVHESNKMAFEYISQYGLGINFQQSFAVSIESPRKNYIFSITDAYVNYRPKLWLSLKLGVSSLLLDYFEEGTFLATDIQPYVSDDDDYIPGAKISVNPATLNMTMPLAGVDFNWTPTKKINIGFGYSITGGTPVLEQQFNALQVDTDPVGDGGIDSAGVGTVVQRFFPITVHRFELKPQFFLSPRMTVGLYLSYMLSNRLKVDKTTIYDDYSMRPWTGDTPSSYELDLWDKYYRISPYILGDGHNVEAVAFTGFMYGISFNFSF